MDHPIREIRRVVDAMLAELDETLDAMYATSGRSSVPPETLLKATVLMAMHSIRSERAFCERLYYDLMFEWFLGMRIDQPAFDASTFSKNRRRLLDHEVADEFFAVVGQAKLRRYVSSDHFSVDGTLQANAPGDASITQELQAHRRPTAVGGASCRPQRRSPVARAETLERHPRLDDRS
jgi:transposase